MERAFLRSASVVPPGLLPPPWPPPPAGVPPADNGAIVRPAAGEEEETGLPDGCGGALIVTDTWMLMGFSGEEEPADGDADDDGDRGEDTPSGRGEGATLHNAIPQTDNRLLRSPSRLDRGGLRGGRVGCGAPSM